MNDRLLKLSDIVKKTGLGKTTVYRHLGTGVFPKPVKVGKRTVRWRESDVDAWIGHLPVSNTAPGKRAGGT